MPCPSKRVHFDNYIFNIYEEVYDPAEDSFLFAENFEVKEGEQVLDLGTGCGLLGILAAKKAERVVAVDFNPFAIRCCKGKFNDSMVYVVKLILFKPAY